MVIECARCGVPFERGNSNQCYCDDCRVPAHKDAQARWYRERHPLYGHTKTIAKKLIGPSIVDLNRAARSCGMTYGQYVLSHGV